MLYKIFSFIISGTLATGADYLVYIFLLNYIPLSLSKAISYMSGTIAVYFLNKIFTFKETGNKNFLKFLGFYALSCILNIIVNAVAYYLFHNYWFAENLAFLIATGASAVFNFIALNYFVFTKKIPPNN